MDDVNAHSLSDFLWLFLCEFSLICYITAPMPRRALSVAKASELCGSEVEEGVKILVESAWVSVAQLKGDLANMLASFRQLKHRAADHNRLATCRKRQVNLADAAPQRNAMDVESRGAAFLRDL
jgi:hypothetical protein